MSERSLPGKSADAYRTIGEAADELKLPQHVLRFWETRFPQVKPLKRAGGRRFYRPDDVALLGAIKTLLYGEGYTIKGVQRLLQEQGPRAVVAAGSVRGGLGQVCPAPLLVLGPSAGMGQPPIIMRRPEREVAMRDDESECPPLVLLAPLQAVRPDRVPRAGEADPGASVSGGHPVPAGPVSDILARLRAVVLDLGECEKLLQAARASRA